MKASKEYIIRKALKNLDFGIKVLNDYYVSHFTEPSLDDINKSYKIIEKELNQLIERNFGDLKKPKE